MASPFTRFLDHTQWHTTVGMTRLDEWSARRRELYLTTNNTHNKHSQDSSGRVISLSQTSTWQHTTLTTSIGLLWTSDQLVAENSTWHTTLTTDIHRAPLDEWSARRRPLTTHNTHDIHRTPLDEWSARRRPLTTHSTHDIHRTPLDEWSARRRPLTTHSTHDRHP